MRYGWGWCLAKQLVHKTTTSEVVLLYFLETFYLWTFLQRFFAHIFELCHSYVSMIGQVRVGALYQFWSRLESWVWVYSSHSCFISNYCCVEIEFICRLLKHMADINQYRLLYKFILLSGRDLTLLMSKPTLSIPVMIVDYQSLVKLWTVWKQFGNLKKLYVCMPLHA